MSAEFTPLFAEQPAPAPYQLITEKLGVTDDEARSLAAIRITCPDPRGQGAELSFGDYISSGHGAGMVDKISTVFRNAKDKGLGSEDAIDWALGLAAVRDENGKLQRVTSEAAEEQKKN